MESTSESAARSSGCTFTASGCPAAWRVPIGRRALAAPGQLAVLAVGKSLSSSRTLLTSAFCTAQPERAGSPIRILRSLIR